MGWTDKYLCPLVERDKFTFGKVVRIIKDCYEIMLHGLSFHKKAKEPAEELPELKSNDIEFKYTICKELYDSANDRLDKLEDKAIKLLSYISAIFAFISFGVINTQFIATKVMLIISMMFLIIAVIISFRCVNVKGRKSLFLPDIYNFQDDVAEENFDKKSISKKLLSHTIYNQNIADNTADILKAATYALSLAIVISLIGFSIGLNSYLKSSSKVTKVNIENQIELKEVQDKLDIMNKSIDELNENTKKLNDNGELKKQINDLENRLKIYDQKYNNSIKNYDSVDEQK